MKEEEGESSRQSENAVQRPILQGAWHNIDSEAASVSAALC